MNSSAGCDPEFLPPAGALALPIPVTNWFRSRFGEPTPIQRMAWPAIANGQNVLISAPTGNGKTLAAFLPLLVPLLEKKTASNNPWSFGSSCRGLYLSPLKALCNDAGRNITHHLAELASYLPSDTILPRLGVRTGDTPALERRAQVNDPPDILLTTPESLAILLSDPERHSLFAEVGWVVIDEVHELAGNKRGCDLSMSLERLERLTNQPLQRIGLSATATPLPEAARFLVGVDRPCAIAATGDSTPMVLKLDPLEPTTTFLHDLAARLDPELRTHSGTLIFANSRNLTERLSWALRRRMPDWDAQIAVHHSSLSAERRREVEVEFKAGNLKAVVSSTSLELGIDIGPVELVALVHPPGDVVRLLQRVGRSGHGPGRVRRGLAITANPAELLEAAVTAASGRAGQCEPLSVRTHPLDVLCQQILGMACAGNWSADEAFSLIRRAWPYRDLSRSDFDRGRSPRPDQRGWIGAPPRTASSRCVAVRVPFRGPS